MSSSYDIILGADFDLPEIPRHGKGLAKVAQSVKTRVLTFLGEVVLDSDQGLPWFTWIEENFANVQAIGGVIRVEVEDTPGVVRVEDWSADLVTETKTFEVSGTVIVEGEGAFGFSAGVSEDEAGNWQPGVMISGGSGAIL